MSGRPGRILMQKMKDSATDTPERVAERLRYRAIGEQANREMMERFSPLTDGNTMAAIEWQGARIRELSGAVQS